MDGLAMLTKSGFVRAKKRRDVARVNHSGLQQARKAILLGLCSGACQLLTRKTDAENMTGSLQ